MAAHVEIPLLPELIDLCSRSAEAHAKLGEFLDNGGFIAAFETDEAATMRAGHPVLRYEPGDGFMRCLAAMRASKRVTDAA